ncbi:hypothetical protein [Paraflavitalea speifideaquila]|uniref:hypothetical protein n=1 Tax=Paraflavitalea speifideaquila TaxID=3076558 RepID=UPI0028E5E4FC|nr:hypothetical protein [Paraflavitalea speifideiaquila]
MIKDSLELNPVNTGIHATIGLIYMLDHTREYIREGDIVVVVPEYDQFYGDFALGGEELLRTALDVPSSKEILQLRKQQVVEIISFIPNYIRNKMNPFEYVSFTPDKWYSRTSFNQYGDANAHWNEPTQKVKPYPQLKGSFNKTVVTELERFFQLMTDKKTQLFISFPGIQRATFDNSVDQIHQVEKALKESKVFDLLGTPEQYKMPDSLIFNTPYHLIGKGVNWRTELLIIDLREKLAKKMQQLIDFINNKTGQTNPNLLHNLNLFV